MDPDVLSLMILFILVALLCGAIMFAMIRVPKGTKESDSREAREITQPSEDQRRTFISFFMIAVLFVVMSVAIAFLYPWALVFTDSVKAGGGSFSMATLIIFIAVFAVALLYLWGRGILNFDERK